MFVPKSAPLISKLLNNTFPCAQFDRTYDRAIHRQHWFNEIQDKANKNSNCGLAIDAREIEQDLLNLKVDIGLGSSTFEEVEGPEGKYRLQVLVIEKEKSGQEIHWQWSAYNDDERSPYYQKGNPIKDYIHRNTLVDILGEPEGDSINVNDLRPLTRERFNYSMDLSLYNDDIRIVAMILRYNASADRFEVLNSQFVDVGEVQPFD